MVAAFDGGAVSSDAGALLLGQADRAIGLIERFAGCFTDHRDARLVEHEVKTLVGQRVVGIALGYEDLTQLDFAGPAVECKIQDRIGSEPRLSLLSQTKPQLPMGGDILAQV